MGAKFLSVLKYLCLATIASFVVACKPTVDRVVTVDSEPLLWPDYNGVTIPRNIAPLNFSTIAYDSLQGIEATIVTSDNQEYRFSGKKHIAFNQKQWKEILKKQAGCELSVFVKEIKNNIEYVYKPFKIKVDDSEIDNYLCYRLIAPSYEIYSQMGIYCRNLTNFEQKTVVDNRLVNSNCVNCHSFCKGNTDLAQLHIRGDLGATVIKDGDEISICKATTDKYKLNCVYPYWHPSGRYIAYSQNKTVQTFHCANANRVEVYDKESRVVVYDRESNKLITSPELNSAATFTTEPSFSPDGKYLYYTTSKSVDMAKYTKEARYDICRIEFSDGCFGNVDTLVYLAKDSLTAAFPRPSYNGKYLLYTRFNYGQFAIWHKEADLWMLNLENGDTFPLTNANSNDVESYHSWSQNSKWIVFESRRDDGSYTRAYIAKINDDGTAEKAFLLPQESPVHNRNLMYSYNVPEFATSEFKINQGTLESKIKSGNRLQFGY